MNENTILFTIGRMNPPTPGHMLLIKSMVERAIRLDLTQIGIILSATTDNVKNPFFCEEKRAYLYGKSELQGNVHGILDTIKEELMREHPDPHYKQLLEAFNVEIVCMDDPTPKEYGSNPVMKSVLYLLNANGYPQKENMKMILMIGQDRATDFQWTGDALSKFSPPIEFQVIPISRPTGAISATVVRNIALSHNWDEFVEIMWPLGLPIGGGGQPTELSGFRGLFLSVFVPPPRFPPRPAILIMVSLFQLL